MKILKKILKNENFKIFLWQYITALVCWLFMFLGWLYARS